LAEKSNIEWTNSTWNPVTGCDKVSAGCAHCYAERFAKRFRGVPGHPFKQGFDLKIWYERVELPLSWKTPRVIFVNSMSDLFHKDVPIPFIRDVFNTMKQAHWHTFQVLTKRAERLEEVSRKLPWAPNIWMGVSVESDRFTYRIDHLRKTGAHIKFLSLEPLLGPLPNLKL
jgi:protein gp37